MKTLRLVIIITVISLSASAQQKNFDEFADDFVSGYKALKMPQLDLSYVTNLQHIGTVAQIKDQQAFFTQIKAGLAAYDQTRLSPLQKTDYQLMAYETGINLQRVDLELRWRQAAAQEVPIKGIITLPDGKEWYAYYLKRWVSDDVTPDQIYRFGLAEVKRVQAHIEAVRKQTGLSEDAFYKQLDDPSFFTSDTNEVKNAFEHTRAVIYAHLPKLFSVTTVPSLQIKRGEAAALAQTPGYYNNNTFYYNLFDKPYNKRQYDWLFIHEGVPGHHYQNSIVAGTKVSKVQELFFYIGFAEGWGAYAEELGKQLGAYQTPYDEMGKWQWDIVRAVRVPLDVALNYYGWTDEQALAFWKKNIRGQDDIALREIARVRRWPAQAVTYKYGAVQILSWKEALAKKQGKNFNIKNFHGRILNHGSLPLFMVRENVFKGNG
ncbi:hypothetical protein BEL04_12495 [Mucilaginibacter sp. PPCGB 2223]|uniref:DUF885 domain-containing protein n=1 Tax=Mucilaginibacter sp. PPCGB 2223 TaxID=1886027 RepID=UPI000825AF33|nr:DUF885 domain-containing protein [Mucilaginibacter sp. PPCGB 2223]OCX52289.1 hypothetical protein BEL04_12495 [Mucilaginibacter sp. PPCGB 2223]